jgi:hypothetical protein
METVIRLRLSELTNSTIEKLKAILRNSSDQEDPEIAILIQPDANKNYFEELYASIKQLEKGDVISFTMEELTEYTRQNKGE